MIPTASEKTSVSDVRKKVDLVNLDLLILFASIVICNQVKGEDYSPPADHIAETVPRAGSLEASIYWHKLPGSNEAIEQVDLCGQVEVFLLSD